MKKGIKAQKVAENISVITEYISFMASHITEWQKTEKHNKI